MNATRLKFLEAITESLIPRFNRLKKLRAAWGKIGDKDNWLVSRLFELSRTDSKATWLDDKTWSDLEYPRIFSDLNTTITPLGGQYLYRQLRRFEYDKEILSQQYRSHEALLKDSVLREELQLILTALEVDSASYIAEALVGSPPELPKYSAWIAAWGCVSLIVLVTVLALKLPLWLCVAVVTINAAIIIKTGPIFSRSADALLSCRRMLGVADRLAAVRTNADVSQLTALRNDREKRDILKRDSRWLSLLASNTAVLANLAVVLNIAFLAKLLAFLFSIRKFARSRKEWLTTFELIGSIDASIAVANFLYRTPNHCRPTVVDEALISFEGAYHPLLLQPVINSVTLDKQSALVTGSNMAGKTTFIKTIGINIVFGHTLGICLASSATIPRSSIMASIRGDQSVESGKSRYFSEVRAIMDFLDAAAEGQCRVFVIDELFSGTNTIERIAVAQAVLEAMSQNAQVLVTTHDVELQSLLTDRFDLFHFQEDPSVEGFFDYKLHQGPGHSRNAIRVLERMGYPQQVIQDALANVDKTNE